MRRPAYVGTVTSVYARLLEEDRPPTRAEVRQLEEAFSRTGFTDAYWRGEKGPQMLGYRPEGTPSGGGPPRREARKEPVRFLCRIEPGSPAELTAEDRQGRRVTVTGAIPEPARTKPLTEAELTQRLSKTGGTPYVCAGVEAVVSPGLSLSASAVNALRRSALEALTEARTALPVRRELPPPPLPEDLPVQGRPSLTVTLTRPDQLSEALLSLHPARVGLPLEQLAGMEVLPKGDTEWCAILPRVWRDQDEPALKALLDKAEALGVTAALLSNLGHFPLLGGRALRRYGDCGLNVFNSRSLAFLKERGLQSACLSFELRFPQIRDLRKPLPAEAVVYGRLPLMLTENCIVRNGTGECRCGEPNVLRDRTGAAFPLLPAYGHRTEVQNSRVLWLADRRDWHRIGLTHARLRFTTESPEECVRVCQAYSENLQQNEEVPPPKDFTRGLYLRGVE